jgi:cell wall assembly regulator SMI1
MITELTLSRKVVETFRSLTEKLGAKYRPPASEKEIDAVAKKCGWKFPADVRTLLTCFDGQDPESNEPLSFHRFCSLSQMVKIHESGIDLRNAGYLDVQPFNPFVKQNRTWQEKWIPITATLFDHNTLNYDLEPGEKGAVGQIILHTREQEVPETVFAVGIEDLLRKCIAQIKATGEIADTHRWHGKVEDPKAYRAKLLNPEA